MSDSLNQLEFDFPRDSTNKTREQIDPEEAAKLHEEQLNRQQTRNQKVEETWKIPPIGQKVKLWCHNVPKPIEGTVVIPKYPKRFNSQEPLVFALQPDDFSLSNNPKAVPEFLNTEVKAWELSQ